MLQKALRSGSDIRAFCVRGKPESLPVNREAAVPPNATGWRRGAMLWAMQALGLGSGCQASGCQASAR